MKTLSVDQLSVITGGGEAAVSEIGQFVGGYYKGLLTSGFNPFVGIISGIIAAARV